MIRPFKKLKMNENTVDVDKLSSSGSNKSNTSSLSQANTCVTPVSILHELCTRKGLTPKYETSQSEGAPHEANFNIRISVNVKHHLNPIVATGYGPSKKEAKQTAAKLILDKLDGIFGESSKLNHQQDKKRNNTKTGEKKSPDGATGANAKTIYYPRQKRINWLQDNNMEENKDHLVICFDVELAFGNEVSEIYQIGAIASDKDKILINILPEGNIHWGVVKYAGTHVSTEFDKVTKRKYLWHSKKRKELSSVVSPIQG